MRNLTAEGRNRLAEIARRHGVSDDAAWSMLIALTRGGGTMAQFSHPEFGGAGQWMLGGMTMVSDLFNNALKATVDGLCNELSILVLNPAPGMWQDPPPAAAAPVGSSWQRQQQGDGSSFGGSSLSSAALGTGFGAGLGNGGGWPAEWGTPSASGAQNDLRYDYFAGACRLVIEIGGARTVYDTADHRITGVSQQQGDGWTLTFTSQYGTVPVSTLRLVDAGAQPAAGASPQAPLAPDSALPQAAALAPEKTGRDLPETQADTPTDTQAAPLADPFADSVWWFGPSGGEATATLTLAADGGITGDEPRVRYWSAENGVLTLYDGDGRVFLRFALPHSQGTVEDPEATLIGHDPARGGLAYALRRRTPPRHAEAPPPTAFPALPLDVTTGPWALEDNAGTRLCVLRLLADGTGRGGRVDGGRGSEVAWRIADSAVVFLHGSGRPTSRFDTFQFRAGQWTLIGAPLTDETATLFLRQA